MAKHIPEATLVPPEKDPQDPAFYVTALRIPSGREAGFTHPVRLYFVMIPDTHPAFVLRVARVAAIGSSTQMLPLLSFLRAWNSAGTGGVIVYEGGGSAEDVRIAVEQAALRFLQRRAEILDWYDRAKDSGRTLVWPVDPNFRPDLCEVCLLPVRAGSKCPKCGSLRLRKSADTPAKAPGEAAESKFSGPPKPELPPKD